MSLHYLIFFLFCAIIVSEAKCKRELPTLTDAHKFVKNRNYESDYYDYGDNSVHSSSEYYTEESSSVERSWKDDFSARNLNYLNNEADPDKPLVELYYETLSPCCRDFYSVPFNRLILEFHPYVNISTFPFGNARIIRVGEDNFIKCQFGPSECYGNSLHACALDIIKNQTLALLYNGCMMRQDIFETGSDDAAADECGRDLKIDSKQVDLVKECAKGERGKSLILHYGKISNEVGFNYVPYIRINGVVWYNYVDQFFDDLCAAFKNPPEPCKHKN